MPCLLEAESKQAEDYRTMLRGVLEESDRLDGQVVGESLGWANKLRERAIGRLQIEAAKGWKMSRRQEILDGLNSLTVDWAKEFHGYLQSQAPEAYKIGLKVADVGAQASGVDLNLHSPSDAALDLLARVAPKDVYSAAQTAMVELQRYTTVTLAGGKSVGHLVEQLATPMDRLGTPWHRVARKVELAARTGLATVQADATQARMEDINGRHPELKMRKMFVSIQHGNKICKVCNPYDGHVYDVKDHQAPRLPKHPNCRCTYIPHVEDLPRAKDGTPAEIAVLGPGGVPQKALDTVSVASSPDDRPIKRVVPEIEPFETLEQSIQWMEDHSNQVFPLPDGTSFRFTESAWLHVVEDHDEDVAEARGRVVQGVPLVVQSPTSVTIGEYHGQPARYYVGSVKVAGDKRKTVILVSTNPPRGGILDMRTWFLVESQKEADEYLSKFKDKP